MTLNPSGRYCMYLRKSRTDRDYESLSIEDTLSRHERDLTALAVSLGIRVGVVYKEVVSGDSIAARPVVQQVLSEIEHGFWDGVIVIDVERLARGDTIDQGIVAQTFKYSGALIITPSKIYDPNNEFDEEYFEFGLFMSRREYKTINRRLQRGRINSVVEGKFIGSTAPYGYIKVKLPRTKGYTLEIDTPKAEVVLMIFNWYCYGEPDENGALIRLGCDQIASKLDGMGIKPPHDEKWSKSTISDILANPTYAGLIRWGYDQEHKIIENGVVTKVRRRNKDCRLVKGLHPAIITLELFELAQKVRRENTLNTVPSNAELKNPVSGIIYCEKCGALMTRLGPNTRNKYATLKCPNKYCDNISAPLYLVEQELLSFLSAWLRNYNINTGLENTSPFSSEISIRKDGLSAIEKEMRTLQKQIDNMHDLLEQGVYSVDIFQKRHSQVAQQLSNLSSQRDNLLTELKRFEDLQNIKEQFAPKVSALLAGYDRNTPAANNAILKELLERVSYLKTTRNKKGDLENRNFTLHVYPRLPS